MLSRRSLLPALAVALAAPALPAVAAPGDFGAFLAGVRAEARRSGISALTLDRALAGVAPDQRVLDKINHPAESTLTWAQYRTLLVTDQRIQDGRAAYRRNAGLFRAVQERYGVSPPVILGIWGLESSYGTKTGDYRVVESLATLAWGSRRRPFFRSELMAALRILQHGDISPARMTGSYAGAMGQPQFMPSSFLRYAVDFQGDGRRDIWTSTPDVLASIANYLEQSGWMPGGTWGMQVAVPPTLDPNMAGRDNRRPMAQWRGLGVHRLGGRPLAGEEPAALLLPDGAGGDAFLVFPNFTAIRRYNPSDFYALVVGLIGDDVLA
ncbi:MAG: lytic murein transglycosylase [Acetobacteraceae bacterium]